MYSPILFITYFYRPCLNKVYEMSGHVSTHPRSIFSVTETKLIRLKIAFRGN
jgi:hypothetical protein